jgi:hypothetical protein
VWIQHLIFILGHSSAEHIPETFDSALMRWTTLWSGIVAADDLDRIAAVRTDDQFAISGYDKWFQFGNIFRDDFPEIPGISSFR